MTESINKKIIRLEKDMNIMINDVKRLHLEKINELKQQRKTIMQQEFNNQLQYFTEIDIKIEFNDWWNLWLKVYDKVYKNNGKYYYLEYNMNDELGEFKEIEIINNFKENINNIIYLKNVIYGHDNKVIYCYVDIETHNKYIYVDKTWKIYNV